MTQAVDVTGQLALPPVVDLENADATWKASQQLCDENAAQLTLDASDLAEVTSIGVQIVFATAAYAGARGKQVFLRHANDPIRQDLALFGLTELSPVPSLST